MAQHLCRPTFTVCLDLETGLIMAHHIDSEPPGIHRALLSPQRAVQPDGPSGGWRCPTEVLIDRSCEFLSVSQQQAPTELENRGAPEIDPQS